ncbi:hypothetical protein H6A32_13140 [Drancourtella massiliensis]|uniref:Uncharacterized protein n=1 Tax=Drancourtella massiliensis TaxID=1632013 RepID=A0ABS2EJQ3_9FIRM|nr:hypothetical protein [Drancourtella massiliensis]MBM6745229.1 hypothetical protein [Drancourtella massiliensis]
MRHKRTEREKKQDILAHYDCLETDVREDARKSFQRQPYPTVDVAQYLAQKFKIGVDADDKSDEVFNTDLLDT